MATDFNEEKTGQKMPRQNKKTRKTVSRVLERLEWMRQGRQRNGDNVWDTWDRLYLNTPLEEPTEDWMSNVFVPFVMSTVLAILSEITSRRTRWKVLPVTKEDEPKTSTIEAITDYSFEKGQWDDESFKRDLDKLIYGTSIWKEYYREDRRVIRNRKVAKDGTEKITSKDIREFNDVHGKHVPIRNFYLDDRATEIRFARDCIEREVLDIRDFKTKYSKYKLSKKVKEWGFIKPSVAEKTIKNLPEGGNLNEDGSFIPKTRLKDNQVEVIEYWNKPNDEHLVVANGVLVIDEPIPYEHKQLPYAIDTCIPKPNSYTGMGICEVLYPLQEETNEWRNMGLNQAKIALHKPIISEGMTTLDEEEWHLRPGAIIDNQGGQITVLDVPMPDGNYHAMTEEIRQDARVASGLDVRFAEGQSTKGNDTATEINRLEEASLRRIGLITKELEIKALPRIGMLRTMNIQQFYRDPLKVQQLVTDADQIETNETTGKRKLKKTFRTIRVKAEGRVGYDFKEITPEDVRGNFDIFVVPQSTQPMSQAVLLKRINVAINTVLASEVALQVVDIAKLFKHFFEQLDLPASIVSDILPEDQQADHGLAEEENQDMSGGSDVPATQNPSLQHTSVHLAFIYEIDEEGRQSGAFSEQFEALENPARQIFLKHIKGEYSQHAVKGNVGGNKDRTPNKVQGTGTQTVAGGGEVESV